ncbi:Uncharacterised protein [Escherichia coli]|nr:Uncharacterised protein [Escherichia coli]
MHIIQFYIKIYFFTCRNFHPSAQIQIKLKGTKAS